MPRTAPYIDLSEADLERLAPSLYTPQGLATRVRSYRRAEGLRSPYRGGRPRKHDRNTEERLADLGLIFLPR